jgi:ribose 5-phosphate isomerase A
MSHARKASPDQLDHIGTIAAEMVRDGDRVGLGSGKAALAFVRALGARITSGKIHAVGVPTSLLTQQVAQQARIPLTTLEQVDALDIAVDGADEVDPHLNLIKGGGGNLTREKVIASISHRLVIVVGEEKMVPRLGTRFPVFVEVIEFARPVVVRRLEALGAKVEQRKNADGAIFLTDNNNPYLLAYFNPENLSKNAAALDAQIRRLPGVVETGLFINMASEVIVAGADGLVRHFKR